MAITVDDNDKYNDMAMAKIVSTHKSAKSLSHGCDLSLDFWIPTL